MASDEMILVTGAGGFIGGWLAETLFLAGAHVRAGIHRWSGAVRLARFPMDIALCDVLNPEQITEALRGVTCVIHCAKGSDESIVQGTRNLIEASLEQGLERFLYVSTTEVYGNPSGTIDETYPCGKTGNSYGDSKTEAEILCWSYHAQGLPVTVIRPPIVYGPLSKTWTVNIALKLQSGNWGIFRARADGLCNLIYIADLVSGILLAARSDHAAGEAFNLNGPEAPTWNEYFQRFNLAIGLPALNVIEPTGASLRAAIMEPVRTSARLAKQHFEAPVRQFGASFGPAKQAMKYVERTIKTTPRMTDFALYNRTASYSAKKARDVLGFSPRFDVDTGLKITARWMEQIGLIRC